MNIMAQKIQSLKNDIEETREKLNSLMDQNELYITEDILNTSHKLDILIAGYYYSFPNRKRGTDF